MAIEQGTLAEDLKKEPEVEPTQLEESTEKAFEEKAEKEKEEASKEEKKEQEEKADKEKNSASESEKEEKVDDAEKEKVEDNACGKDKMEESTKKEEMAEKEVKEDKAEAKKEEEKVEKCEKSEDKEKTEKEDKPLTKSERKTYEANEKSYLAKIAALKAELNAYKPYKAMYEQAELENKELLEYKEEAELNKLMQQKSDYFKTFGMADFDDDDRDEIIKKINDYDFSYQDFKAFMADKVQKYGMKSRFQNITDIINMYADNSDIADKYAESDSESDEDKILNRYNNI